MINLKALKLLTNNMKILYVEDEDNIRYEVKHYLQRLFAHVETAKNGESGYQKYQHGAYDIVLSDISMPLMNGLEMSKLIRGFNENQEIIIVSAYSSSEYFIQSIEIGVSGYIIKPINFNQMNETLYRSAVKIQALNETEEYKQHLVEMVDERTEKLNHALENERQLQHEKIDNYEKTIFSFIDMVERRDTYTAGHSGRVAKYSKMIAREMGYSQSECNKLYQAAMLHDVGKIVTPDSVLLKPGKLNDLEFRLIKEHVITSYELLKKIPMYQDLAEIIRFHHERCDGKGYPDGFKGDEIPVLSRIMIIADAFDAMTTSRIYKGRITLQEALEQIKELKGAQFHPHEADCAIKVLQDINLDEDVNQLPATEIEEERFAYFFKDQLTDVYNKNYLDFILLKNKEEQCHQFVNVLFVGQFTAFNSSYGWEFGDKLLADIANCLKLNYPDNLIFRIHGDDFLLLSHTEFHIDLSVFQVLDLVKDSTIILQTKQCKLNELNIDHLDDLKATLSTG